MHVSFKMVWGQLKRHGWLGMSIFRNMTTGQLKLPPFINWGPVWQPHGCGAGGPVHSGWGWLLGSVFVATVVVAVPGVDSPL